MAKRTMQDYMDLMNYLYNNESSLSSVFGSMDLEEILKSYTLDRIYTKLEDHEIKNLVMGQFVGVEISEKVAKSKDVQCDQYSNLDYGDIMDIKYGNVLEYLPEEKVYKVLAVAGDRGDDHLVLMKLKYNQIKILFNEKYDEYRYDLIKCIGKFANNIIEKEG